jgi:hypothetical protein
LSRYAWLWLGLCLGVSAPVAALTLAFQQGTKTLTIADNTELDQDPGIGRIRYQGSLDLVTTSPFQVDIQAQEIFTPQGWELTLSSPAEGIANGGEPAKLQLIVTSSALNLQNPVAITLGFQGTWADISDGRQQINSQGNWSLSTEDTPLQRLVLEPVQSMGKTVAFTQGAKFEAPRSLQSLTSTLVVDLGTGDALALTKLSVIAQGQTPFDPRWLYLGGAIAGFGLLSFIFIRQQARR